MKKIVFFLLVCMPIFALADNHNHPTGARSDGMGKAAVAIIDVWASYHNQATLALLKNKSVAVYYENKFQTKELSTKAICFNMPTNWGTFAANYTQYGFELYKESKIGIAYAKALGKHFWAGLQFNQIRKDIQMENGTQSKFNFEVGLLAELVQNLFVGCHISNPTQTAFTMEDYDDKIPTIVRVGACLKLNNKGIISCEVSKDFESDFSLKIGAEYPVTKNISIRAGAGNHPNNISLGVGFSYAKLNTNIAFSRHPILGYTPSIDLSFKF